MVVFIITVSDTLQIHSGILEINDVDFCRCIGSIQHLKAKYGRGYSLEIKLREELTGLQQVALLHKEILRIFPHAARQERYVFRTMVKRGKKIYFWLHLLPVVLQFCYPDGL